MLTDEDLTGWTALGLATACAELVGTMRGALDLTVGLRRRAPPVRRRHRFLPGRPAPAGRRPRRHGGVAQRRPPRRLGRGRAGGPPTRWPRRQWPRPGAPGAARTVGETAIQVHGGIGNTWECLAHVHLRRALLSADVLGGEGASVARVLHRAASARAAVGAGNGTEACGMDFRDSPDEAAFRGAPARVAARQQPRPAGLVDRRRLLAGPGGLAPVPLRRRLLRPVVARRGRRPRSAERLRRHPRRGAGGRRGAAAAQLSATSCRASSTTAARTSASASCPASSTAASAGARGSASPTPAPTSPRCAPGPIATATSTSSPARRCGPATPTWPTGASCWPAPITTCPATRASRPSSCPCASRASSSGRCA